MTGLPRAGGGVAVGQQAQTTRDVRSQRELAARRGTWLLVAARVCAEGAVP